MSTDRRLLLVAGCVVCILLVVAAFPAADPRLETPGSGEGTSGDWESLTETPERTNDPSGETGTPTPSETSTPSEMPTPSDASAAELAPVVEGSTIPGTEARVSVPSDALEGSEYTRVTILVNGEKTGEATMARWASFTVPAAESFTVTVEESGETVTVPTYTDIRITADGEQIPGRELQVEASIGGSPVANGTVTVDGQQVASTDSDGKAAVELPGTAGPADISVEKGVLSGTYTAEVAEPSVAFSTPLLFPGAPAHVTVTADGRPVEDATVRLDDGSTATTGSNGGTWIRLPVADEVTVTGEVAAAETSTTVSDLILRTTLIVLIIPGLVIGAVWTYGRLASRRPMNSSFVVGTLLVAATIGHLTTALVILVYRIPSVISTGVTAVGNLPTTLMSLPSEGLLPSRPWNFDLPRLRGSLSVPSLPSLGVPSIGGLLDSVTSPSASTRRSLSDSVRSIFSDDDTEDAVDTPESAVAEDATDSVAERPPRQQLRETWHRFLDTVGVRERETRTPGEASRHALAAGYPRRSVRRLLGLFRTVEYSDTEPSEDDVAAAREALETVADHEPEEDST